MSSRNDSEATGSLRDLIAITVQAYQSALEAYAHVRADESLNVVNQQSNLRSGEMAELRDIETAYKVRHATLLPANGRASELGGMAIELAVSAREALADAAAAFVKGSTGTKALSGAGASFEASDLAETFAQAHMTYAEFRIRLIDFVQELAAGGFWQQALRLLLPFLADHQDGLYTKACLVSERLLGTIKEGQSRADLEAAETILLESAEPVRLVLASVLTEIEHQLIFHARQRSDASALDLHVRRLFETQLEDVSGLLPPVGDLHRWHLLKPREVWAIPFDDATQVHLADLPTAHRVSNCLIIVGTTRRLEVWSVPERRRLYADYLPMSLEPGKSGATVEPKDYRLGITKSGNILVVNGVLDHQYTKGFMVNWASGKVTLIHYMSDYFPKSEYPLVTLEPGRSSSGTSRVAISKGGPILYVRGEQVDFAAASGLKARAGAVSSDGTLVALLGSDDIVHCFAPVLPSEIASWPNGRRR